jgi:hypothetical protein
MPTFGAALMIALLTVQSQSLGPWTFRHLGTSYSVAKQTFLADPPASIVVEKSTGQPKVSRGYFVFVRIEEWFGVPVRVSYGFSSRDSTLGYLLATYIESSRLKESTIGLRDSLWHRLRRSHRAPDKDRMEGISQQRVWDDPGQKVVVTKVDGVAQTLVISLTKRAVDE